MSKKRVIKWQPGLSPRENFVPPPVKPFYHGRPEPTISSELEETWRGMPAGTMVVAAAHFVPILVVPTDGQPVHPFLKPNKMKKIPPDCRLPVGGTAVYLGTVMSYEAGRVRELHRIRHRFLVGDQVYVITDLDLLSVHRPGEEETCDAQ
ncbi:MAG: hypothetical protein EBT03_13495 [Betaproteobacteria bacterium]|nr:hypothetical protein [Betaproteobacteria bacterium]NCA17943.1 hypothetical protein [Betaproteobacteria bacterium]